ncbi:sporulation-specific protein 22 [Mucor circinelloides]
MHQKQLTFFLEDLLPSLNATNLIDNQVFIKRIWDRSKQLDVVENDDEGRKLTQYALKLWNMTIEMIMLINTTHTQKLSIVATLKDICFNILCKNQQWKDNNSWTYLHVITALFRIWLDSDNINNIEDKLINEMKKYNAIDLNSDLPDHCIRDVIKCYIYQSEYASHSGKWSECTEFFEKATHLVLAMSSSEKCDEIAYLCYLVLDTGASMSKSVSRSSVDVITWVFDALGKILNCKGSVSLPKYLYNPLLELTMFVCQKDTHILRSNVLKSVLTTFDHAFSQDMKTDVRYYLSKIHIQLKAVSLLSDSLHKTLQTEYFKMVENVVITADDLNMLVVTVRKLNQNRNVGLSTIMDGLDLLIHRAENNLMGPSVDSSTLYLCKIFILSELAIENSRSSVQCSDDIIRSAMDAIFLIKEDIEEVDLSTIQVVLWRTGDFFYDRRCYKEALPWYHYAYAATQSTFQETDNAIILAKKLSFCHIESNDPHSAYQCMKRCHDDQTHWTTEDFIVLLKYGLMQTTLSQEECTYSCPKTTHWHSFIYFIVMNNIMEDIIESSSFKPDYFVVILEYCYQYGKKGSLLKVATSYITNYYAANEIKESEDKDALYNAQCLQINIIVWVLRCVVHIKTTVYEETKSDGKSRTRKLDFKSIADFMLLVVDLLGDIDMTKFISERKENKVNHKLMNDLEWMLQTSWNLGLFCFSAGRHTEGMCLFDVISELFPYFDNISYFTKEQDRVRTFLFTASYILMYNNALEKGEGWGHAMNANSQAVVDMLQTVKKESDNDAISMLASVFELEIYTHQGNFDMAYTLFEAVESLSECSYSLLERMAGIVLLNPQCPVDCKCYLEEGKKKQATNGFDVRCFSRIKETTSIS